MYRVRNMADIGSFFPVAGHYDFLNRGYPLCNLSSTGKRIKGLPFIEIAINGKQNLWLDLTEAINGCSGTDIRGTRSPDSTNTRAGKHRHSCLYHVGHIGSYPVSGLDSYSAKRFCQASYRVV